MRWFEQDTSNLRCNLTQFHRPAKLKLTRTGRSGIALPYVHRTYGFFMSFEISKKVR